MKKLVILLFALALCLTACARGEEHPELHGYYEGTDIHAEGYTLAMDRVYGGENYLRLDAGGKGQICLTGNVYDIRWSLRGETFRLTLQGETSKGYVKQGDIYLDYMSQGTEFCFCFREDYIPHVERDLTEEQLRWHGDWYGWWIVDEGHGSFADVQGAWWDLCATVTMLGNDTGTMILWDQDSSKEEPLGEIQFRLNEEGLAVSTQGYFGAVTIGQNDWIMDPEESGIDNMLMLSFGGENDTGSFYYSIYLRPWGEDWEGLADKPYHYDSWYLPLIAEGKPMPDRLPEIK